MWVEQVIRDKIEPIYIQEELKDLKSGERKGQYGLTLICAIVMLGIFVYVGSEFYR